jgi:hypothetical protein
MEQPDVEITPRCKFTTPVTTGGDEGKTAKVVVGGRCENRSQPFVGRSRERNARLPTGRGRIDENRSPVLEERDDRIG